MSFWQGYCFAPVTSTRTSCPVLLLSYLWRCQNREVGGAVRLKRGLGGRGKLPSVMHCGNLFQYQSYTHWCLGSFSSLESKGNIALFHYSFTSLYFTSLFAQSANIQFGFQATLNPVSPLETCHFAELWAQTYNGQQKVHSSLQRPKPQPYRVISCGRVICYQSIYV